VNKRARVRLIGVTAVILLAVVGMVMITGNKQGAYEGDLAAVAKNSSLVGKQVKVGGTVVSGSWDKKSNPMRFTIRGRRTRAAPADLKSSTPDRSGDIRRWRGCHRYGQARSRWHGPGDRHDHEVPIEIRSATGATPIGDLIGKGASMEGKPVRVTGYVKAGSIQPASSSGDRFVVAGAADGSGLTIPVTFSGVLPSGIKDGSQVVMGGTLSSGKFVATSVALQQGQ